MTQKIKLSKPYLQNDLQTQKLQRHFYFFWGLAVKCHKRDNVNLGSLKDLEGSRMLDVKVISYFRG
jgi:hypothetical protein